MNKKSGNTARHKIHFWSSLTFSGSVWGLWPFSVIRLKKTGFCVFHQEMLMKIPNSVSADEQNQPKYQFLGTQSMLEYGNCK